eukprot:4062508-Amphidinium_carterae.1
MSTTNNLTPNLQHMQEWQKTVGKYASTRSAIHDGGLIFSLPVVPNGTTLRKQLHPSCARRQANPMSEHGARSRLHTKICCPPSKRDHQLRSYHV